MANRVPNKLIIGVMAIAWFIAALLYIFNPTFFPAWFGAIPCALVCLHRLFGSTSLFGGL